MTSDTAEDIPMQSEAPEVDSTVMAPSGSASVSIALHPLVIMNVSEHYTRTKAQGEIRDAKGVYMGIDYELFHLLNRIMVSIANGCKQSNYILPSNFSSKESIDDV